MNKSERFTQRSRKVLELTSAEAERLGHTQIDSRHLLLGILREPGASARAVLYSAGLEFLPTSQLIERMDGKNHEFKKPHQTMQFTDEINEILEFSVEEAQKMGGRYVGTEHLLLGLLRHPDSLALTVLREFDINPDELRETTRNLERVLDTQRVGAVIPIVSRQPQVQIKSEEITPMQLHTALGHTHIHSLRQQAEIRNQWLTERLDTLVPALMTREGFDLWLVIAREYNEDPVILSLIPQPSMSARRRTILAFHRQPDGSVERFSIDRYGFKGFYEPKWDADSGEGQYECLGRIVRELNPQSIGLNISGEWSFGDGLSHSEYTQVIAALGTELTARVKSAERLCVGWLETRIPAEITAYPNIIKIGHALIEEAFSTRVIHPGITTTDDVVWWMRQTMLDLGVGAWFHPTVEIQAQGQGFDNPAPGMKRPERRLLIQPGDLLHCDVGFIYLGLATDQQQHAYVLKPGEIDAPPGLKTALGDGNKLQSILTTEMQIGRTGNEVLAAALATARHNGITPSIYSHPLGFHGHAAGPTIGLWDKQGGVPGQGDYPLYDNTVYSIELNVVHPVAEWDDQPVRIALEEDAVLTGGEMRWLDGRQTAFHLIG